MIAAHKKFNDVVRILVNAGANPSYISSQKRMALYYGNDETRAIILGYNGPEYRKRKIYEAVQENSVDGVKYLLKIGKNIDEVGEQGNTPFLLARQSGNAEIAKLLVTFGCNRFAVNSDGDNALILAVKNGRNEVITILHQVGFHFYDIKNGKSLLMIAIEFNHIEVAKQLLMYGQDITYQDPSGKNALFYAIEYGRSDFIVYLANQNTFNSRVEGCDAMLYACLKGKQAVLEELIKLNFISSKKDAFLMACRGDNVNICDFWIRNGIDINSTNSDDESALMISLKYGFRVPGYLLNHNPNINYTNSRGHSAFSYAVLYENPFSRRNACKNQS
ncbi:hypothetical protein TVAG_184280 [Trichomonas vaginalis G3]|uniref:Uncharacterized protein n=1 Tax=Trichomonas vaginalis (strain ATCC PRA-98 / G3) TaxID=412133 RepID=A2E9W4_TRIV3|nr:protein ubiquitination [Trichomonas vaginalis G3]EAY10526.1 hypothetical protein TVAG_184280 [Trichomonas vaginalis G3]KAI5551958.1 protein ubiquitination [Trichomonas vaginalis G3]|eukprot:XP_001322749.1 hypothetical protein [Trichomonas vaginalis G3]